MATPNGHHVHNSNHGQRAAWPAVELVVAPFRLDGGKVSFAWRQIGAEQPFGSGAHYQRERFLVLLEAGLVGGICPRL